MALVLAIHDVRSEAMLLLTDGSPSDTLSLREGGTYKITAECDSEADLTIAISDAKLCSDSHKIVPGQTEASWTWAVEHYAGEVPLCIRDEEKVLGRWTLQVSPNPYKLGRDYHAELLAELQRMAEGVVFGLTAGGTQIAEYECDTPLLATYSLFKALYSQLESAFVSIAECPHRRLKATREMVSLHRARKCDARTIVRAARTPAVMSVLSGRRLAGATHAKVDVPHMEHTYDTAPNRYVAYLLFRLVRTCRMLKDTLNSYTSEDESAELRTRAWAKDLVHIEGGLSKMVRARFLDGICAVGSDASALTAVAHHPEYARFLRLARAILNPRVDLGTESDTLMTLRPTYDLYEYWCFFRLAELVKKHLPNMQWRVHMDTKDGTLLRDLPNGSYLRGNDGELGVELVFQRTYSYGPLDGSTPRSMSLQFRPDYVLTVEKDGIARRVVFDAKYRSTYPSIRDALRDMHVYRDGIRISREQSAIDAAYILVPAFDSSSARFFETQYRDKHGFGGFVLTPGSDGAVCLKEKLAELIS